MFALFKCRKTVRLTVISCLQHDRKKNHKLYLNKITLFSPVIQRNQDFRHNIFFYRRILPNHEFLGFFSRFAYCWFIQEKKKLCSRWAFIALLLAHMKHKERTPQRTNHSKAYFLMTSWEKISLCICSLSLSLFLYVCLEFLYFFHYG